MLEFLKKEIQEIYQDQLIGLYSYEDSLVEFNQGKILKHQFLLVVTDYTQNQLESQFRLQKILQKKILRHQSVSMKLFTKEELVNSLDVFPIEFLDLKENRALLLGDDILKTLDISLINLRHECEFYLRTYILKLREGYIQPRRDVSFLIRESLPFLISIFKYLLVIHKKSVPKGNSEVILYLSDELKFDRDVFYKILGHLHEKDLEKYFFIYLKELETITQQIDKLHV